ncbi:MAG: class I SAM-dependent methyltransferase [Pseudomonadota bacterium]
MSPRSGGLARERVGARAVASAELYALTHRGNPGDVEFYERLCRGARRVLELGSGSGRVAIALAGARRNVVGLELDAGFLALARRNLRGASAAKQRYLRLIHGDFRDFELGERFERVLLPYNALYCLLTKSAALSCFRAAHRALEPGGLFAFDVWNAAPFARSRTSEAAEDDEPVVSFRHGARTWDVFEHSRVQRARQRLQVSYDYRAREDGSSLHMVIPQRYFLAAELDDLLTRAGFTVQARYGDFAEARFTARAPQQIVIARAR